VPITIAATSSNKSASRLDVGNRFFDRSVWHSGKITHLFCATSFLVAIVAMPGQVPGQVSGQQPGFRPGAAVPHRNMPNQNSAELARQRFLQKQKAARQAALAKQQQQSPPAQNIERQTRRLETSNQTRGQLKSVLRRPPTQTQPSAQVANTPAEHTRAEHTRVEQRGRMRTVARTSYQFSDQQLPANQQFQGGQSDDNVQQEWYVPEIQQDDQAVEVAELPVPTQYGNVQPAGGQPFTAPQNPIQRNTIPQLPEPQLNEPPRRSAILQNEMHQLNDQMNQSFGQQKFQQVPQPVSQDPTNQPPMTGQLPSSGNLRPPAEIMSAPQPYSLPPRVGLLQEERSVIDNSQPQVIPHNPSPRNVPRNQMPVNDPFADKTPNFRPASQYRTLRQEDNAQPALTNPQNGLRGGTSNQDSPTENINQSDDDQPQSSSEKSCDEFRAELMSQSIMNIDLNISPYGPTSDGVPTTVYGPNRTWTDKHGNVLATGSMVKLRHGYVHVDSGSGIVRVPVSRLGESDLAAVGSVWEIPEYCTLGLHPFPERCWTPQTFTWKASALCHKPLYFEDIQLERYGHSAGPIRQPIRSTAHFFVNLLTVSYQTGIHHPNECQYALGYYRPGNCAPWLVDPIPISLSGAARQTLTTTAGAFLFFP